MQSKNENKLLLRDFIHTLQNQIIVKMEETYQEQQKKLIAALIELKQIKKKLKSGNRI